MLIDDGGTQNAPPNTAAEGDTRAQQRRKYVTAYLKLWDEVYIGLVSDGEGLPRPMVDGPTVQAATATIWRTWEKKRLV